MKNAGYRIYICHQKHCNQSVFFFFQNNTSILTLIKITRNFRFMYLGIILFIAIFYQNEKKTQIFKRESILSATFANSNENIQTPGGGQPPKNYYFSHF